MNSMTGTMNDAGSLTGFASGSSAEPTTRPARLRSFIKKLRAYVRGLRAPKDRPPARNDNVRVVDLCSQTLEAQEINIWRQAGGARVRLGEGYLWIEGKVL